VGTAELVSKNNHWFMWCPPRTDGRCQPTRAPYGGVTVGALALGAPLQFEYQNNDCLLERTSTAAVGSAHRDPPTPPHNQTAKDFEDCAPGSTRRASYHSPPPGGPATRSTSANFAFFGLTGDHYPLPQPPRKGIRQVPSVSAKRFARVLDLRHSPVGRSFLHERFVRQLDHRAGGR